jgi:hypothetical protein
LAVVFVLGISTFPEPSFAAGKIQAKVAKFVQNHPKAAAQVAPKVIQNNSAAKNVATKVIQNNVAPAAVASARVPAIVSQYVANHPNAVEIVQNNPALQSQITNYVQDNNILPSGSILPGWNAVVVEDNYNDSHNNNNSNSYTEPRNSSESTYVAWEGIACPFTPADNRTIVSFDTQLVWGKTTESSEYVNLPAGNYRVYAMTHDGYADRVNITQTGESFFTEFKNGSSVIAQSNTSNDLRDRVAQASWSGVLNSSLNVPQSVTSVSVRHANYLNGSTGSNSVTVGCLAIDLLDTPSSEDDLQGSCSVNPSSINVGGSLNWSASATGGDGQYSYTWSGTDGLVGYSSSISKSYNSTGTKTGTVTIQSDGQSVSYTCNSVVNQNNNNNDLSVSCDADDSSVDVDEDVTYRAYASGGSGSYSYDWDGSEDLRGSSRTVTWSYDDDGTKTATVTVTSGGETAMASCRVRVDDDNDNNDDDLDVSCYANPTNPRIGERMNWYVDVDGGDGDYDYDWNGTDGLDSSSEHPTMTYYDSGTKTATVRVRSDGETETATCRAYVNQNSVLAYSQSYPNQVLDAVYLNQVPYTGLGDNTSVTWFTLGLALFSAWIAYIVISYKKQVGEME